MSRKVIKVSKEFSNVPKGRYHPEDGLYTGQRFREELIEPIFNDYDKLVIDLDDLYGCPSSFREESFGGLARVYGSQVVLDKLDFICTDQPPLKELIISDIKEAND